MITLSQLEKELEQMKAAGKKVIVIDYVLTQIKAPTSDDKADKLLRLVRE